MSRFQLEAVVRCFLFLLHRMSCHQSELLFPTSMADRSQRVYEEITMAIPGAGVWPGMASDHGQHCGDDTNFVQRVRNFMGYRTVNRIQTTMWKKCPYDVGRLERLSRTPSSKYNSTKPQHVSRQSRAKL